MKKQWLAWAVVAAVGVASIDHPLLWFDHGLIAQGELWRLITCNLVHSGSLHLALNLSALAALLPFLRTGRDIAFLALCGLIVGIGLMAVLEPKYGYGGLSGILFGAGARALWALRANARLRALVPAALAALLAKIAWDLARFPTPSMSDPGAVLVPHAHLLGVFGAALWIGGAEWLKSRHSVRQPAAAGVMVLALGLLAGEARGADPVHLQSDIPWLDYRRLSFYLGAGYVRGTATETQIRDSLGSTGIALDTFSLNVNRYGYHLGLAYEITSKLHVEGMYFNFGRVAVEASGTGITEAQLAAAFQDRLPGTGSGPLLALKANQWIGNPFHRVFARGGLFAARSGYDLTATANIRRSERTFVVGAGYEYFFRRGMSVRGEANYSRLNGESVFYVGPTLVLYLDGIPREEMPKPAPEAPAPPSARPPEFRTVIYFGFDEASFLESEKEKIRQALEFLARNPGTVAVMTGHTDSYGTSRYNVRLSERRIESVERALVESGADRARLRARDPFGEDKAVQGNWLPDARQLNRRVNLCILPEAISGEAPCTGSEEAQRLVAPKGDLRLSCRSGEELRVLEAVHAGTPRGGCVVRVRRGEGPAKRVGRADNDLEHCSRILGQERAKLEKRGFTCVDESGQGEPRPEAGSGAGGGPSHD